MEADQRETFASARVLAFETGEPHLALCNPDTTCRAMARKGYDE
jgi:hypothetical protein